MAEEQSIEQEVAELECELPIMENHMLAILHGDAVEFFEPPEVVAAYEQEVSRRIAAGTYLPAN